MDDSVNKQHDYLASTHDMHFEYIIEDLIKMAFENVLLNRKSEYRPTGTGKYKKSPIQSGNAAVVCLLLFILFESTLRRKYYNDIKNPKKAYNNDLWKIYLKYNPAADKTDELKDVFDELVLIRHSVAHGYLFEGYMTRNEEYKIVGIDEKPVTGRYVKQLSRRRTARLRLCASPNQIGFKDAAVFYAASYALLKLADLDFPYSLWKWEKTGEELTPYEWLKKAMRYLSYGKAKVWHRLDEMIEHADYASFLGLLGTLGLDEICSDDIWPTE